MKEKTGKPGATATYTNQAIVTMVSLKSVFGLPGRALCGFVESIFKLMQVGLSVPDHTTISRRLKRLEVRLPVNPMSGKRHVVIDSTGVKVYGEGEWKRCDPARHTALGNAQQDRLVVGHWLKLRCFGLRQPLVAKSHHAK